MKARRVEGNETNQITPELVYLCVPEGDFLVQSLLLRLRQFTLLLPASLARLFVDKRREQASSPSHQRQGREGRERGGTDR